MAEAAAPIESDENVKILTETAGQNDVNQSDAEGESVIPECAVCLQNCVHPAQLPCGHIFCFLCVKGLVLLSNECAMCRKNIPSDYLDKPHLLEQVDKENFVTDDSYHWFYEGRNGWWQYEERIAADVEQIFGLGEPELEIMICGTLYIIDFINMEQYSKYNPRRKRKIKRDLKNSVNKGIAGIRTTVSS